MPHVVALYRHPIKGFTPEALESLTVQADGRVAGDRVLAFRFADAAIPEDHDGLDYWPKSKGLSLQDFPALAALRMSYDDSAHRVRIEHDGSLLVEAELDEDGRAALVSAVTEVVLSTREGRRLQRPGRLPLVLVGDGVTSRFQDRARGYVSLHSHGSTRALGGALGDAHGVPADDRRFRSNVVIEGVDAWEELGWSGEVRIGTVTFHAAGPIVRCLATHANPDTGVRDAKVLTTLTGNLGQEEPTLGRLLVAAADSTGGVIRIGDEVHATA